MKSGLVLATCVAFLFTSAFVMADPVPDRAVAVDTSVPPNDPNLRLLGSLDNSRTVFEKTGKGTVAFIGGSITEREGYRPIVCAGLQKRFPNTRFTFINAGVSSTASITGAFRLQDEVLSRGPIDLILVEFAVNDDQDAHYSRAECIRGMEGIIRHVRLTNPNADMVVTYFVNESMLADFKAGKDPLSSSSHEVVAEHYDVPVVALNREVSQRIEGGKLTWDQYGGVHPGPMGNALGANMILQLLDQSWSAPLASNAAVIAHQLPAPIDPDSYFNGNLVDVDQARIINGWKVGVPDWPKIPGEFRPMFAGRKFITATEPGATLSLPFEGNAVGIYLQAGPDAGVVEASVDGGAPQKFDLFSPFSAKLHYPRSIVFQSGLSPGRHLLTLKLTGDKNPYSKGTAARIMDFCVN